MITSDEISSPHVSTVGPRVAARRVDQARHVGVSALVLLALLGLVALGVLAYVGAARSMARGSSNDLGAMSCQSTYTSASGYGGMDSVQEILLCWDADWYLIAPGTQDIR
jgi:hypothetical protein